MNTQTDDLPRKPRRWLPWVLGGLLGCALCSVLAVAGALILGGTLLWRFVDRAHVDPAALKAAVEWAVATTLQEGDVQQRVELLEQLEQTGAEARPFVPQLVECTKDDDPRVREAAMRALRAMDPTAAGALQPETD